MKSEDGQMRTSLLLKRWKRLVAYLPSLGAHILLNVCWPTTQFLQLGIIFGRKMQEDPYHLELIRSKFPRVLPAILPLLADELDETLPKFLSARDNGTWHKCHR